MEFLTLQLGINWNIRMLERDLWHENNHREIIGIILTINMFFIDLWLFEKPSDLERGIDG